MAKKEKSLYPLVFSILTAIALLIGTLDGIMYSKYYKGGRYKKMLHPTPRVDMTDPNGNTDFGKIYYAPIAEEHIVIDEERSTSGYIDNEVLIVVNDGVSRDQVVELADSFKAEIVGEIEATGDYQLRLVTIPDELDLIVDQLALEEIVAEAYPNYIATVSSCSKKIGDFCFGNEWDDDLENYNDIVGYSWGFEAINTVGAWNLLANANDVNPIKVGIHDCGFDPDHEDLGFAGYYYENGVNRIRSNNSDGRAHGTHVSGTFAASTDTNVGICGVYPYGNGNLYGVSNSGILHYSENGSFFICAMSEKVAFAELIVRNVRVINQSLGFNYRPNDFGIYNDDGKLVGFDYAGLEAFWNNPESHTYLVERSIYLGEFFSRLIRNGYDFVLVSAAGNDSSESIKLESKYSSWLNMIDGTLFPSVYDRIIVVGALDENLNISSFSNAGERTDIYAPGENIYSTIPGNKYDNEDWDGTSMAAPHVAGVAAMIWSANNSLTGAEVKEIIVNNTNERNTSLEIVDAERCVGVALGIERSYELMEKDTGCLFGFVEDKYEKEKVPKKTKLLDQPSEEDYKEVPIKIKNAKVTIQNKETEEKYTTFTDIDGHYEFYPPAGKYYLTVEAEDYETFEWPGKMSFTKTVTVTSNYVEYLSTIKMEPVEGKKTKNYLPEEGKIYTSKDIAEYIDGGSSDEKIGLALDKVKAWTYYDGHFYALFDHAISSKFMSVITNKDSNVHLVTITSEGEQKLVENLIFYGGRDVYYTGGLVDKNGDVYTINGERTNYTHWYVDYPNSYGKDEYDDIIAIWRGSGEDPKSSEDYGYWFDIPENEWSFLDFTDIEISEISRGIILEWDTPIG
ncbi:MAG: S8 family serine peptidase [Ruminococcus sp.]|nr:S8 family serine peptidase [Ruminococcus sp.]